MFYTISSIAPVCAQLHAEGKKIVLATGFFDLLHQEHVNFLSKAKGAGNILIVGVESDARARQLKGEGRPVETQAIRCQKVAAYTDYVIALSDDFDSQSAYESLMSAIRPAVYAVSSHTQFLDNKRLLTEKYGGQLVVVHHWNPSISSTKIIREMRAPHSNPNDNVAE